MLEDPFSALVSVLLELTVKSLVIAVHEKSTLLYIEGVDLN